MKKYFFAIALLAGTLVLTAAGDAFGQKRKLTLTISLPNRKVAVGEPLVVNLVFKNISSSPVEFMYFKPHFWVPRVIDPKTNEKLPFNIAEYFALRQLSSAKTGENLSLNAETITGTNIPVERIHRRLAAGEMATEQSFSLYVFDKPSQEDLTYIVINPGKYKLQLEARLLNNKTQDLDWMLTSNQIPVEIVASSSAVQEKPKLVVPQDNWEKVFFAEIDKTARFAGLRDLRSQVLPADDLEIRVWVGFGLWRKRAFIVRREAGKWSAAYLRGYVPKPLIKNYQNLKPPKSGWKAFWKQIVDEGVLTLPDASELKNEKLKDDGASVVVETNLNGIYRAYHYNDPDYQEWKEARRMMKISNLIAEEFDLSEFKFERQEPFKN